MKSNEPTITIYLEKRKQKTDDLIPLKVRVTWKKKRKYYAIPKSEMDKVLTGNCKEFRYSGPGDYAIREEYFDKATAPRPRGKFADLKNAFDKILIHAKSVSTKMKYFDFENFRILLFGQVQTANTSEVFQTFENYIKLLKDEGRIRTAVSYNCTLTSLKGYHQKDKLSFERITVDFLKDYEKWMKETGTSGKGNNQTTIGINMRQLRAIYNQRPKELESLPKPFGEKKYEIPKTKGRKIALQIDDLKKVFDYNPKPGSPEQRYFDFWRLQYLLNGINLTDLCLLRYGNFEGEYLKFERHKTKRTRKEPEPIKIPLTDTTNDLLNKYGQPRKSDKTFIFPILSDSMTPEEQDQKIYQLANLITQTIKRIARNVGLDPVLASKINGYSSRHSFATILMNAGAPVAYISKQLGHTSLETTSNYLASFEDKHLQEWQSKLIDF